MSKNTKNNQARIIFSAVFMGLLLVAIYMQRSVFQLALHSLSHVDPLLFALGFAASFATYVFAALNYQCLSIYKLRFSRTLVVQLAALSVNRLLPSGLGSLGMNYAYLRHNKHTVAQAGTVVTMNNLLGFVSSGLLVLVAVFAGGVRLHGNGSKIILIALSCVALLCAVAYLARTRFAKQFTQVSGALARYRQSPKKLCTALLSACCLTLSNAAVLLVSLQAVHGSLSFWQILIAVTVGVGVGASVPTPGGIGGVEAGTAAALLAYGVPKEMALAAALLFRIITYWLGLFSGVLAFLYVQRRRYLG